MAYTTRKSADDIAFALASAHNLFVRKVVAGLMTYFHHDTLSTPSGSYMAPVATTRTVTAADSSSLATSRTLARDIYPIYVLHIADTLAHDAADSTNTIAFGLPAASESLANLITWANQAKAAYNAHRTQASVHPLNDTVNIVTASDATDQSSLNTLLNDIKAQLIAHLASSPGSVMVNVVAS